MEPSPVGVSSKQPARRGGSVQPICVVYSFIHRATGKRDIGSSIEVERRRKRHLKSALTGSKNYFHRALREFGEKAFDFEIVEECLPEVRLEREKHFIEFYNSLCPNGFNLNGDPTKGWNFEFTDAIRARLSEAGKGNKRLLGHFPSLETRAKMSASAKGNKHGLGYRHTQEGLAKLALASKGNKYGLGYHHTVEARAKISTSLKGNKRSLGYFHSDEHKSKTSKSMKRWMKKHPGTMSRVALERWKNPKPETFLRGEENPASILTRPEVTEIRTLRSAGKLLKEIASQFQVSESTVSLIAQRKIWKEVI